ncbi:cation:proton antiporter [Qipengyuania sp. 1NDW9]|uniref:Cation:proton antiporter n=1 Tax=Qipengyuania xiapuensis TaxID=2867236 RepID=A0ABX8ZV51_9SPHN|nr:MULTISPECIES: cation:proton antiporter [Qipengyuania]MBX7492950.1 cation:proton antiporter [Qipengyuania xiapuensis]MBY6128576.1 cation:proton antiporter [Qipengyuania aquimaris]QZD92888.1 cation:proton antiporter [Qipengyuania xiapuensis]UOR14993.1 cation:proton antiporter [Qipengyuania aquimaris]
MASGELASPALSDALVILGAAGLVIPVFTRFRITPVIGFILIGILVGPYGLGQMVFERPWLEHITISDPGALDIFAEFGIILLLFAIGLELSFKRLWQLRRLVFGLGAAELLIGGLCLAVVLSMMGQYWIGALALGFALAFSSTAIVLPISGSTSPVGRAALSMLLFEDIMIVPIVFILGAMAPNAASEGWEGLMTTLWQGALVIAVMMIAGRFALPRLFAQAARTKSPELFLAASLLVVIGASLATAAVGLSPIVGALIAGLLIAETEYHSEVESIMEPFKGLALGIFLITIGMTIDLRTIWDNLGAIATAVIGVLVFKALLTGVLLRLMGARRSTAAETGILMASPSETTLIVLAAAGSALLLQPGTVQFWQIVTAIGLTVTPLLARLGRIVARQIEPAPELPDEDEDEPRVIIIGAGRVGQIIAQMLDTHEKPYVALDSDADLIESAKRQGFRAVFGDAARGDALHRLGIDNALAVVLTMDEPILAERLVRKLRGEYPDLLIVARARDVEHAAELYRAGASHAVPETLEATLQLTEAVLVDIGVAMGPVIASIHEKRDDFRAQIEEKGALDYKPKLRSSTSQG